MFILNNDINHQPCICCSGKAYQDCCLPFHLKNVYPETAEKLMRSRFSAFQLQLKDYLLESWSEATRPASIAFTPGLNWLKLEINGRKKGRKKDKEGWVTFVAHYKQDGVSGSLHEKSFFKRNQLGHWQYIDGEIK